MSWLKKLSQSVFSKNDFSFLKGEVVKEDVLDCYKHDISLKKDDNTVGQFPY